MRSVLSRISKLSNGLDPLRSSSEEEEEETARTQNPHSVAMRRGIGIAKLAAPPPSSAAAAAAFSSFSGAGGFGRGRGRGSSPSPDSEDVSDEDPFFSGSGRGRGRAIGDGSRTSSPHLPSFPSLFGSSSSSSQGRGRGMPAPDSPLQPPQNPDVRYKKPVFFNRDEPVMPGPAHEEPIREPDMSSFVSALGRGKPVTKPHPPEAVLEQGERPSRQMPKREDAAKRAMEILSRGGGSGRGAKGRGRGGRGGRGVQEREPERVQIEGPNIDWREVDYHQLDYEDRMEFLEYVKADIGEEEWNKCKEEAKKKKVMTPYAVAKLKEAQHANNMIEFEPEYLVNFANPDIEEKPPMSLEEVLETAKPFLMAYEGINSQEEWEEIVKHGMKWLPMIKKTVDNYAGPDVVTAKQQQQELQRVADTLPANAPTSVKNFTDRVLLSLQSNPGWGFDKKCQFMDKLSWEINQHYK